MAIYNYGIGGNEIKVDAGEAISELDSNRTLLIQQMTNEAPASPELEFDLRTMEDVFNKYQPKVQVEFTDAEGAPKKETLEFNNLADFSAKNITQNSKFLNELSLQQEQYAKMRKQLSSNTVLQKALKDDATRQAILDAIEEGLKDLADANK